jgi:hypothetical protein
MAAVAAASVAAQVMARNRHRPPIDASTVAVVLSFMIQSSSLNAGA